MIKKLYNIILGFGILIFVFMPHNLYAQYTNGTTKVPNAQPMDKYKTYIDERKLNVYRSYGFRDWYFGLALGYVINPKDKRRIQGVDMQTKQSNGFNLNFEGGFHISRWFSFGLSADLQRSSATIVPLNATDKIGNMDTQRFALAPILTFYPVGSDQKLYLPYIGIGLGQQFAKTSFGPNVNTPFVNEDFGDSGLVVKLKWGIDFSLDSSMRVGVRHDHQFLDILNDASKQVDIFSINAAADF